MQAIFHLTPGLTEQIFDSYRFWAEGTLISASVVPQHGDLKQTVIIKKNLSILPALTDSLSQCDTACRKVLSIVNIISGSLVLKQRSREPNVNCCSLCTWQSYWSCLELTMLKETPSIDESWHKNEETVQIFSFAGSWWLYQYLCNQSTFLLQISRHSPVGLFFAHEKTEYVWLMT